MVTVSTTSGTPAAGAYSFELVEITDTATGAYRSIQTKQNDANGIVKFDTLTYKVADLAQEAVPYLHRYAIRQVVPSTNANQYDQHIYLVDVTAYKRSDQRNNPYIVLDVNTGGTTPISTLNPFTKSGMVSSTSREQTFINSLQTPAAAQPVIAKIMNLDGSSPQPVDFIIRVYDANYRPYTGQVSWSTGVTPVANTVNAFEFQITPSSAQGFNRTKYLTTGLPANVRYIITPKPSTKYTVSAADTQGNNVGYVGTTSITANFTYKAYSGTSTYYVPAFVLNNGQPFADGMTAIAQTWSGPTAGGSVFSISSTSTQIASKVPSGSSITPTQTFSVNSTLTETTAGSGVYNVVDESKLLNSYDNYSITADSYPIFNATSTNTATLSIRNNFAYSNTAIQNRIRLPYLVMVNGQPYIGTATMSDGRSLSTANGILTMGYGDVFNLKVPAGAAVTVTPLETYEYWKTSLGGFDQGTENAVFTATAPAAGGTVTADFYMSFDETQGIWYRDLNNGSPLASKRLYDTTTSTRSEMMLTGGEFKFALYPATSDGTIVGETFGYGTNQDTQLSAGNGNAARIVFDFDVYPKLAAYLQDAPADGKYVVMREVIPGAAVNSQGVRYDAATAADKLNEWFTLDGIQYNPKDTLFTMTMAYDQNGTLTFDVTGVNNTKQANEDVGVLIDNQTKPADITSKSLTVKKEVTNITDGHGDSYWRTSIAGAQDFNFVVQASSNGYPIGSLYTLSAQKYDANGAASGAPVALTGQQLFDGYSVKLRHNQSVKITGLPMGATYTVSETNLPAHYSSDMPDNKASGVVSEDTTRVVKNTYTLNATTNFSVSKRFDKPLTGGEFTFDVYDMNPKSPKYNQVIQSATNDAQGNVVFTNVPIYFTDFNGVSIYYFKIVERKTSDLRDVVYDTHYALVPVTVANYGGSDQLTITQHPVEWYSENGARDYTRNAFVNTTKKVTLAVTGGSGVSLIGVAIVLLGIGAYGCKRYVLPRVVPQVAARLGLVPSGMVRGSQTKSQSQRESRRGSQHVARHKGESK